jgi:hypothetical protein
MKSMKSRRGDSYSRVTSLTRSETAQLSAAGSFVAVEVDSLLPSSEGVVPSRGSNDCADRGAHARGGADGSSARLACLSLFCEHFL